MSWSLPTGKGSDGKIIKYKMPKTEGEELLFHLTNRQRGLLLQNIEYLRWMKRYTSLPDGWTQDDLDQFVDTLALRLMEMVEFCEQVINCIENDEDTINALNSYLLNQLTTNPEFLNSIVQALSPAIGTEQNANGGMSNLILNHPDCDFEALAGAMVTLVDWLNLNNTDFLERLAQAATPATRARVMSELIPNFAGGLAGEALSEAITYISGALKTNYEAYYDVAYKDALVRELLCLALTTCSISVNQLYAVFSSRIGYTPVGIDTFIQAFTFAVTGEVTGYQFADVMMFLQIGAFKFMGGFVGLRGLNPLTDALTLGWDVPTDDYNDLDCPDEWCRLLDASNGLDTVLTSYNNGSSDQAYWTGTGWARNPSGFPSRITIRFDSVVARNITTIRVVNSEDITGGTDNTKTLYTLPSFFTVATTNGDADTTFDVHNALASWFIDEVTDSGDVSPTATPVPGEITAIYIKGFGTPPDFGIEC